jgi:CDP-diacylglycerol--inositol 3-phosphatidyltransferase
MDSSIPWALAIVSFPIMAAKQFLNVVQLVKASRRIAETDVAARRAQGLPRKKNN